MDCLEVRELVVVGVDADAEEEARVPPVDDLERAELDEVGLVLLVPRRDEPVHLAFELDLLFVLGFRCVCQIWAVPLPLPTLFKSEKLRRRRRTYAIRSVPFRQTGLASIIVSIVSNPRHCLEGIEWMRSTHCRFWIRMNESTIFFVPRL